MSLSDFSSILSEYKTISVIGTGKGSGKTTVINYLASQAKRNSLKVAITAQGAGGSDTPHLIPSGSLVAIAKNCMLTKKLELLNETKAYSPYGNIVIGRAPEDLQGFIAGAGILMDLQKVKEAIFDYSFDLLLIDGALDKSSTTSASLADGFVLAAGVDFPESSPLLEIPSRIEQLTLPISQFSPPPLSQYLYFKEGEWLPLSLEALDIEKVAGTEAIFWPGPFLKDDLLLLEGLPLPLTIILEEPWHLFLSADTWKELQKKEEIFFKCLRRSQLLYVSLNPHSEEGWAVDITSLKEQLQSSFTVPFYNLLD